MTTVTVSIAGEGDHEVDLEAIGGDALSGPDAPTYADLLSAVELSPHEASVLVEGRPVPDDRPVEAEHVTVLRLIKGG